MKRTISKMLFFLAVLSLSNAFSAGAVGIKTFTVSDGLLDSTINCVYQDKKGIIWFGSNKGITRYDGINFKSFKTSNADERVRVLAIFQDKSGIMWVITEISVLMWNGAEFSEISKYHGLTSFCLDAKGNKWLGSKNGIIILGEGLDEKEMKAIGRITGVTALFRDHDSNIWIGTEKSVYQYDGRVLERYTKEDGLAGERINFIYDDGESIFFATDGGVSYYNGTLWNSYTVKDGLADNYVTSIFRDFRGNYWFGTKNGLSIFDESTVNFYDAWKKMTVAEGLADNNITCLFNDGSANLWIGTKNGVTKQNISFDYLIKVQGVKEQLSAPVFIDQENRLWISTEDGVTLFSDRAYERLKEEDGISGKVLSVYQNPGDERIYFGTTHGVNIYEGGSISVTHKPVFKKREWRFTETGAHVNEEVFPDKDMGLVGHRVKAISRDTDDNIWVATDMSLNKLIQGENHWKTYTTAEGILNNIVNDLFLDDDGTLYIATKSGINTYRDEEFGDPITTENGLAHNEVLSVFKNKKGILWFGTKKGVTRYDGEKYFNITVDDGLSGDNVYTMFEDARGFMWFATEGGLTKYDGENFSIFTTVDGLLVNDVLSIAQEGNGIMWFGTDFGVMRYLPDNVAPSSIVKNAPEEPLVIPKYAFEVTGADLNSARHELLFSYRLDDGEWTKFSSNNVFFADNLKNGTHHFYVRAKDKSLNIEDPPLDVAFEVNTKMFDIEITDIKFSEIFSVLYQYYNSIRDVKKYPLGEITLKNNFDKDIKVKINSFVKDYMDYSADTRGVVKAGKTSRVPLRLEFNENILNAPTGYKKVNITIQYYLHGENKENAINSSMMIYDKNTLTWDDPKKIGAFVTVDEEVTSSFVRKIVQMYKDESKESIIYDNLIRAMEVFDALGAYGIRYISDPTSPYASLKKKENALDTLRFPKQTLELKSGDCDDCVVLYCAMLENIGINTAAIDTKDHLFMMFDVGLKKKDIEQITQDESMVYIDGDDNIWIPVESTLFGKTFTHAWEVGAKKFSDTKDKDIYYLKDAWESYQPAELAGSEEDIAKITIPAKEKIDEIYKQDVEAQEGKLLYNLVAKYEQAIKDNPDDAQAYNSLGIVYAKNGYLDKAEDNFKKVIELKPDYAGGHSNLGNIFFEKEYYDKAVHEYKKALILKPKSAKIYIEVAITYSMMGDFAKAKEAYLEAIKNDPDVEKDYLK